jgi:hypothetical protein
MGSVQPVSCLILGITTRSHIRRVIERLCGLSRADIHLHVRAKSRSSLLMLSSWLLAALSRDDTHWTGTTTTLRRQQCLRSEIGKINRYEESSYTLCSMTFAARSQTAQCRPRRPISTPTSHPPHGPNQLLPQQHVSIRSVCRYCITSASANLDVVLHDTRARHSMTLGVTSRSASPRLTGYQVVGYTWSLDTSPSFSLSRPDSDQCLERRTRVTHPRAGLCLCLLGGKRGSGFGEEAI